MTVGELLDVFDANRDMGLTVKILDFNGEVQASIKTNSELIKTIECKEINSIDGEEIRLWIEGFTH